MPEVTTTSTTIATIKISLFASILGFLEYLGIPKEPFGLLGVLMAIDMVTGITKQKAVNLYSDPKYFKDITSTRFTFGIVKKLIILTVICAVAISIKALGFSGNTLLTFALAWFITAEIYSIIQNAYIIYTGKFLPEFDATSIVLKALANFVRQSAETRVQQFEEVNKIQEEKSQEEKNNQ